MLKVQVPQRIFSLCFFIHLLPCKPIFLAGHGIKIDSVVSCSSIVSDKTGYPVSLQELLQLWMPALSSSSPLPSDWLKFHVIQHLGLILQAKKKGHSVFHKK